MFLRTSPSGSELTASPTLPAGSGRDAHTADQPRRTGYHVTLPSGDRTQVTSCRGEPERGGGSPFRGIRVNRSTRTQCAEHRPPPLLESPINEDSGERRAHRAFCQSQVQVSECAARGRPCAVHPGPAPGDRVDLTCRSGRPSPGPACRTHPVERVLWAQTAAGADRGDGGCSGFRGLSQHPPGHIHRLP